MAKRNPDSPWNPALAPEITPKEYEEQVVAWLRASGESKLENFRVNHLEMVPGTSGEYEIDAIAEFSVFNGARIKVVVECKRYTRPVERDKLLTLWAKTQDVNAHKAMMFATCGFQSGAIEYATIKGIATVAFTNGEFLFETRGLRQDALPPPWLNLPRFVGIFMSGRGESIQCATIETRNVKALSEWLSI